jgi:hypothetical protein
VNVKKEVHKIYVRCGQIIKDADAGRIDKVTYWHEYMLLYNKMKALKKAHPELPPIPKCSLTKEQQESVEIQWLKVN